MSKRTALFAEHQKLGGRIIDFGGWELPVQYTSVIEEHLTCRESAGLFDVSHMGEIMVEGGGAEAFLNHLVTNNVSRIAVGQAQYTVMCHKAGGIIDDLVIYRRGKDRFLVVVNASNVEKDFNHMVTVRETTPTQWENCSVTNESSKYSQIAIQGKNAIKILQMITTSPLEAVKTYWFLEGTVLGEIPAILARTGYTGEDGFEIYLPWESGPEVWRALLQSGAPFGLKPCGLGARDTLRLEMKYPLYGHELSEETNPLEAGLSWVVKLEKADFIGKSAIVAKKEKSLDRLLVGFKLIDRGIPRQGYKVFDPLGRDQIGEVMSGTQSPCLKQSIGTAYVAHSFAAVGNRITVDIRGTKVLGEIIPTPFYKRSY